MDVRAALAALALALGGASALACSDATADEWELEFATDYETLSLAAQMQLSEVEINQGVAVEFIRAGSYVTREDRNAPLVSGRGALVTARWTLEADFVAHEMLARLQVFRPDAEPVIHDQVLHVPQPSNTPGLTPVFEFELGPEELDPDASVSLELWEVDPRFVPPPDPVSVESPLGDSGTPDQKQPGFEPEVSPDALARLPFGIEPDRLGMRVVLVPVEAQWPGCSTRVPAAALRPAIADALERVIPLQASEIEIEVRDTSLILDRAPDALSELFPALQQARVDDQADPNVYYYAVLDACARAVDGRGGLAFRASVPADPEAAWQRVAVGLHWPDNLAWTLKTAVHEIGHLQGLRHVDCPGTTHTVVEDAYPHDQGSIGVWGFDVLSGARHDPARTYDYMSYCTEDSWVSDWTWARTFDRVRTLTAWDTDAQPDAQPDSQPDASVLVAMLAADGSQQWWTTPGRLSAHDRALSPAHLRHPSSPLTGHHEAMADGAGELVFFELPPGSSGELEHLHGATLALVESATHTLELSVLIR